MAVKARTRNRTAATFGTAALVVSLIALVGNLWAADPGSTAAEPESARPKMLFKSVKPQTDEVAAQQLKALDRIRNSPSTVGVTVGRFQPAALDDAEAPLDIRLSADQQLELRGYTITPIGEDRKLVDWTSDKDNRSVFLSVSGTQVTGMIYIGNKVYAVEPLSDKNGKGKGLHAIIQIDQTKFAKEHPPAAQDKNPHKEDSKEK